MTRSLAIAAIAALLAAPAFAKGHDQGVADGDFEPGAQTGAAVKGGIGDNVNGGKRGDQASGLGGGNRTTPVVGNGANADE